MARFQPEQPDAAVAAILRASRRSPDPVWVDELERRMLKQRPSPRRWFMPVALAGGLATVAVTLSLAGVGPLVRSPDTVDARDDCQVVTVPAIERVPVLVRDARGAPTLIYRDQTVKRRVTRCSRSAPPRAAGGPGRER